MSNPLSYNLTDRVFPEPQPLSHADLLYIDDESHSVAGVYCPECLNIRYFDPEDVILSRTMDGQLKVTLGTDEHIDCPGNAYWLQDAKGKSWKLAAGRIQKTQQVTLERAVATLTPTDKDTA